MPAITALQYSAIPDSISMPSPLASSLPSSSSSITSETRIAPTTTLITITKKASSLSHAHSHTSDLSSSRSRNKIIATEIPNDGSYAGSTDGSYNSDGSDTGAAVDTGAYDPSTVAQTSAVLQGTSPTASWNAASTYSTAYSIAPSSTIDVFTNSALAPLVSGASFSVSSQTTYAPLPTLEPLNSTSYSPSGGADGTNNSTSNAASHLNSGPTLPVILIPMFLAFAVILGAAGYTLWRKRKSPGYRRNDEKLLEHGSSAGIAKWWRDREYSVAIGSGAIDVPIYSGFSKGYETFEQVPSLRKTTSNAAIIHHARVLSETLTRKTSVLSQHSSQHSSDGSSLGSISVDFHDALGIMPGSPTEQEWLASVARRQSSSRHKTMTEPQVVPVVRRTSFVLPSAAVPRPFGLAYTRGHTQRPSVSAAVLPACTPVAETAEPSEPSDPFDDSSASPWPHGLGFGTYGQRKRPLTLIDTPDLHHDTVSIVNKELPMTPMSLPFDKEADIAEAGPSNGTLSRHYSL